MHMHWLNAPDGQVQRSSRAVTPMVPTISHVMYLLLQGDNDPTDVIDISSRSLPQGVYRGKILGAYALIDDGELDWKACPFQHDPATHCMACYLPLSMC
jgi:Inorganic pyrophosphatase